MNSLIHLIVSVESVGGYSLRVGFNDGLVRVIDFEPILRGEIFGPLRNFELFAQVKVDQEVNTIVWPTGADFDPVILHDWPEHEAAFRAAAKEWGGRDASV